MAIAVQCSESMGRPIDRSSVSFFNKKSLKIHPVHKETIMDIIKWRESYETGVGPMDTQHKKLIDLINILYRAIRNKESSDSISEVLEEMNSYAEIHLQEEESLLKEAGFPELAAHIASHQTYRERVKTLIAESRTGNEEVLKQTYKFLREWWMGHIVVDDKEYGEFFASKGLE